MGGVSIKGKAHTLNLAPRDEQLGRVLDKEVRQQQAEHGVRTLVDAAGELPRLLCLQE